MVRALYIAVLVILAIAISVIAIFPEDDLTVGSWFWTPATGFWMSEWSLPALLRRVSMWPTIAIGIAALVSILQHIIAPASRQFMSARAALFLFLTVAAAPVLVVNGVFKEVWDRARPVHVTQFGGPWQFTPWWQPGNGRECRTNCSFVSGEASGAAWLAAPALLAPPAARVPLLAGVAAYTAVISGLRMAFGGHFLSDTLIAILITLVMIAAAHRWLYRRPNAVPEDVWAARLARLGAPLRRLAGRPG
ncbi:phosphatase PAP2 family protein [Phreatobacter sp.]|uniref:phosphatase PAP2 family protein n=1 Tax=Phreatobacter sp. TaxID=1966341 RepID=UPI0022CBBCDD|nr:phosphatase PAP2 family protein [Phreatobacter sp.]MCZ8315688.1 phosphatase PAP2 family protein [Phreatobacter sp.]